MLFGGVGVQGFCRFGGSGMGSRLKPKTPKVTHNPSQVRLGGVARSLGT